MRALVRLLLACVHLLRGYWTVRMRFGALSAPQRAGAVEQWARQMLRIMGIELLVHGVPPSAGPTLLVANHISWLDILVLHAARHCRFVSKAEVRHWPLIGVAATGAGTLYVERESRRDALRVVHHMVEALRAGDVLAVFPEGTTGDGAGLLPFHANLFQAALSAPASVTPLALRFIDTRTGVRSLAPAYVGDDSLVGSVWRTLSAAHVRAEVSFGEPLDVVGLDRRQASALARARIAAQLGLDES